MRQRATPPRWPAAALLALLPLGAATLAAPDSDEWTAASTLAQQIQAPVRQLWEPERKQFLALFASLQAEGAGLSAEESALVARLSAEQAALKAQVEETANYESERAAWQVRRSEHEQACNRKFSNPADVASCDLKGAGLAKERNALDRWLVDLQQRRGALRAKQTESVALVASLEDRTAAWRRRVGTDFRAPLAKALARKVGTTTLRLTVKSFIREVDLASMSADSRPRAEQIFARFTNRSFAEDPKTPAPDSGDFRLWSQAVAVVDCRGDRIASWKTSNLAHRSGRELELLWAQTSVRDPLAVAPAAQGAEDNRASVSISYAIKGKPNDAALSSFRWVRPRSCDSIWHRVRATVSCDDGQARMAVDVTGSRFPSHRVWTNGDVAATVVQGPFANLWDCDPSAPDLVR